MNKNIKSQSGFTLIEMIVSLGVFAIVVTTAVGAILVLIGTNQRLQSEQSVMTNLSFALDTMTRELRTGFNYYCASANSGSIFEGNNHESIGGNTLDCASGNTSSLNYHGVSFYEGGDSVTGSGNRRILYYFDRDEGTIMRRVGNGEALSIVSSGLEIVDAQFYVTGSDKLLSGGDTEQPTVTISVTAREINGGVSPKNYYLHTTVTQRALDL
jgi:prepilin-type N-terminal cleavage/methylation domain-containing protein